MILNKINEILFKKKLVTYAEKLIMALPSRERPTNLAKREEFLL